MASSHWHGTRTIMWWHWQSTPSKGQGDGRGDGGEDGRGGERGLMWWHWQGRPSNFLLTTTHKPSAGARMRKKQGALWRHKSPDQTIDSKPVRLWGRLVASPPKIVPKQGHCWSQPQNLYKSIKNVFGRFVTVLAQRGVLVLPETDGETNSLSSNFPSGKSALCFLTQRSL